MPRIRHTVIFTFYDTTTSEEQQETVDRLNEMGAWLVENIGVTDWVVAEHIPESFKPKRAHLLQDCVFPDVDSLNKHASSGAHQRVVELTPKVSDWMTIDTIVPES